MAAAPTGAAVPGPVRDFSWCGLTWHRRTREEAWGPAYNRSYEANNVTPPNARGDVTLRVTNPTGRSPVSAEMSTTRRGFGYGTYSMTVVKRLDAMQPELVWGCLFTYDPDAEPGFTEIDVCEASAWGGNGHRRPVTQAHGYWFDATKDPGAGSTMVSFSAGTTEDVQTHRLVWEPGKLTYQTFAGEGFDGSVLKQTTLHGPNVPVQARERLHINFWVFGGNGGNPDLVSEDSVTVRNLSFTAASSGLPASP